MDSLSEWARWAIGGIAVGGVTVWGHLTGRISTLEKTSATSAELAEHIRYENEQLRVIFDKQDATNEKLSTIATAVARIEGSLDKHRKTESNDTHGKS